MPPAARLKKTVADLAQELEEVKSRLAALEAKSEQETPTISDLTESPVVLVMIDRTARPDRKLPDKRRRRDETVKGGRTSM